MRYIALLRGINVGGNTMIKMAELKAAFEQCGFENVVTYINSGNIAFDCTSPRLSKGESSNAAEEKLTSKIEQAIEKHFNKQIPTMIREQSAIEGIIASNPFAGQFAKQFAAAGRNLSREQLRLAESLCPIWNQRTMRGAGDGVFIHTDPRHKEA